MTTPLLFACKKLCLMRCIAAMSMSVIIQFLLLAVFLLFINFNILHPIQWTTQSIGLVMSFYTWLTSIPLILVVMIYSCLLGRELVSVKRHYGTRFSWFVKAFPRKICFLCLHILTGFLTAWLYTKYVHEDYRTLTYECCEGKSCLNGANAFLLSSGIVASCLYFIKENLKQEPQVEFPLLQEVKWVRMRSLFYSTVYNSLVKSLIPSLCYILIFWLLTPYNLKSFASLLNVGLQGDQCTFFGMLINVRLVFYNWILTAQIYSNMHLMGKLLSITLTEEIAFVVEKTTLSKVNGDLMEIEVSLVDALAMEQLPIIQNLAALHLYNIGCSSIPSKRQDVFALSVPGGHPYNWNHLCNQCLIMLNKFIEELNVSLKSISTIKSSPIIYQSEKPSATEIAERILLRQYNKINGIRRMAQNAQPPQNLMGPKPLTSVERINAYFEHLYRQWQLALQTTFRSIPGVLYLFNEPEGAKTVYLLSQSQIIIWLIEGLTGICTASIKEDRFGIVQTMLPQIIRAFIQLKNELNKLQNVVLNGKRMDRNLFALRNAVKRSLYRIATVFGDYLDDLIDDPLILRTLNCCVHYQDI